MASTILRSCRAVYCSLQKMQPVAKTLLRHETIIKQQNIAAMFMITPKVRCMSGERRKDDLFRQITLEVKGHDPAILNSYQKFTEMAAKKLGITISKIFEPPRVITRKSLLKSVFIYKKHMHQYEMRTLYKVIELKHLTGSTADTFLEYIERNLPEGLAMKVTKHQISKLPKHLKPPSGPQAPLSNLSSGAGSEQLSEVTSDVDTSISEAPSSSPSPSLPKSTNPQNNMPSPDTNL